MCWGVAVWQSGGMWEAYFTPFAAAHQNKHKQMRVSVLLCLGSAFPSSAYSPASLPPPPSANEANVPCYVAHAGVRKNKNSLNFKSFFPLFCEAPNVAKAFDTFVLGQISRHKYAYACVCVYNKPRVLQFPHSYGP